MPWAPKRLVNKPLFSVDPGEPVKLHSFGVIWSHSSKSFCLSWSCGHCVCTNIFGGFLGTLSCILISLSVKPIGLWSFLSNPSKRLPNWHPPVGTEQATRQKDFFGIFSRLCYPRLKRNFSRLSIEVLYIPNLACTIWPPELSWPERKVCCFFLVICGKSTGFPPVTYFMISSRVLPNSIL